MTLDLQELADQSANLAVQGVYVGTSSWKCPGWFGMLYDRARYEYRGNFAMTRLNRECLPLSIPSRSRAQTTLSLVVA